MSRLIVKNLPNVVTQQQIENHFSQTDRVTDVKLKYKKNKEFRGFAFIGYETEEAANQALIRYQNTFFKKNKITVAKCEDLDHNLKKAESEKAQKTTASNPSNDKKYFKHTLKQCNELTKEKLETLMNNPAFIQYLKLNKKGTADLVDTLKEKYVKLQKKELKKDKEKEDKEEEEEEEEEEDETDNEEVEEEESLANRNISDLEYLQSLRKASSNGLKKEKVKKWEKLFTVIVRTKEQNTTTEKKGKTLTKKGIRDFFRPLKYNSLRIPRGVSFVAYVGFKTEKVMNQALVKDKSFLDGVRVRVHKYEERESFGEDLSTEAPAWKAAEEKVQKEADPVGESGKLFVRNLWYSVTEEDLRKLFEQIGPLAELTLPVSKLTQKSKGFAHVSYTFPEHAVEAMNQLDGSSFQGRVLHIMPSLTKDENDAEENDFKKKKEKDLKKSAGSWHNWNSLFLGSGAVIDLFADKVKKSKYEIFEDKEDKSVAVNLALSETLAVENTKRFLEEHNVSLEAFSNPNVQRSTTVILAKNLPAGTKATELKPSFEKYGEIGRFILPPSGVTGIIEFLNASEAKKAFEGLAYSRFKWLPLFLEWAPIEVFTAQLVRKEQKIDIEKPKASEDTTLYVKNLNFETTEDILREHFTQFGEIACVLIAKRRTLSQGYGFVQYVSAADADKAMKARQNSKLDGHALTIKKSEKKLTTDVKPGIHVYTPGEATSSKLLIRNIPFQATWQEVRQLFQTFGEIKLVRLPKKLGSSEHRGFGFVDFASKENAKKALEALGSSTHLYGRRIVLEYANEEETVEEIRKRTADKFLSSGSSQKRQKIEVPSDSNQDGDEIDDL